ncbi:MAG: hypothetical protein K2L62_03505, partial [Muribaculaceae bacterium]|nr:hypothetical protein [Muribaculaceae bacterium]
MNMRTRTTGILVWVALAIMAALAGECPAAKGAGWEVPGLNILEKMAKTEKIPLDSAIVNDRTADETVIVGGDTVSIVLPQKNYGRYDRGLFNFLFVPKGQWSFGLQASYGEFNTADVQILSILKDFNVKVKAYSLQPYI